MSSSARGRNSANSGGKATRSAEGVGYGATVGGALGAIVAAFTATGSVAAIAATGGAATPLVVGPLAAALAGAGAGGLTGGLLGGLIGAGIPEDRARLQQNEVDAGGILVGVEADSVNADRVRYILNKDGAIDIQNSNNRDLSQAEAQDIADRSAVP